MLVVRDGLLRRAARQGLRVFNGKTSHTSTDGAVFLLRKNAAEDFYTELVKVGENEGRGTICHAGGICPNGNYVCIAKITFDGNENIEKSVIYRSRIRFLSRSWRVSWWK